jgi:uncharacterized membrane protein YkoI
MGLAPPIHSNLLTMKPELSRRTLILMMLGMGHCLSAGEARASDDDSGGNSGSGSSGSGSSGSGGSGENQRGKGKGKGGHDSPEREDDDDDNDDEVGEGGSSEALEAQNAVVQGKAKPLRDLLTYLDQNYPGQILDVDLKRSSGNLEYRLKILQESGKVIKLRLDAMSLKPR